MREPAYLKQKQPILNKLLFQAQTSYADGDLLIMIISCSRKPPQYINRGILKHLIYHESYFFLDWLGRLPYMDSRVAYANNVWFATFISHYRGFGHHSILRLVLALAEESGCPVYSYLP
jgi:hypothetical protein